MQGFCFLLSQAICRFPLVAFAFLVGFFCFFQLTVPLQFALSPLQLSSLLIFSTFHMQSQASLIIAVFLQQLCCLVFHALGMKSSCVCISLHGCLLHALLL